MPVAWVRAPVIGSGSPPTESSPANPYRPEHVVDFDVTLSGGYNAANTQWFGAVTGPQGELDALSQEPVTVLTESNALASLRQLPFISDDATADSFRRL